MNLRVAIVDDEPPARDKLRRYLAMADGIELIGEAGDGRSALELLIRTRPDVLFLDVRLPDMNGFAVLQALSSPLPAEVIFVTAHADYALQAFEVHAFDYLLKPVGPERFDRMLARLRERARPARDPSDRLDRLLDSLPAPRTHVTHLLLQADDHGELVSTERISRIEANRNYVWIYAGGRRYRLRATLERLFSRLPPDQFVRVNRSTVVRLGAIREWAPWPDGEYRLRLDDDARVTWTRRYLAHAPAGLWLHS